LFVRIPGRVSGPRTAHHRTFLVAVTLTPIVYSQVQDTPPEQAVLDAFQPVQTNTTCSTEGAKTFDGGIEVINPSKHPTVEVIPAATKRAFQFPTIETSFIRVTLLDPSRNVLGSKPW
jgi:hypothetical protein